MENYKVGDLVIATHPGYDRIVFQVVKLYVDFATLQVYNYYNEERKDYIDRWKISYVVLNYDKFEPFQVKEINFLE